MNRHLPPYVIAAFLLTACAKQVEVTCDGCENFEFKVQDVYLFATQKHADTPELTTATLSKLFYGAVPAVHHQRHQVVYMNVYDAENDFICQIYNQGGAAKIEWAYEETTREFY